jgi:hypothetical protein
MQRKLPACDRTENRRLDTRATRLPRRWGLAANSRLRSVRESIVCKAELPGPPVLFGKQIRRGEACPGPILLAYFDSNLHHRNQLRERTTR